jgi:hypothetical protein
MLTTPGRLFHQRCVLLRHLVHLRDRLSDLADAFALLMAGGGDSGNHKAVFLAEAVASFDKHCHTAM